MNCERAKVELPDFLAGNLSPAACAEVQSHLENCADCSELAAVWTKLGSIPEEMPPPRIRTRFHEMLAREATPLARPRAWIWQAAAAAVIALFGFAAGRYLPREQANEISGLRREMQDMRGMFAMSLLQQQSASDRLRGVSYAYQMDKGDAQIREALLETLNADSSVDVRLAAVDALRRMAAQPTVRQGFLDSLDRPQSPLVQIALIDAVVDLNDRKSVTVLRKLQITSDTDELVKQRARWGLDQMRARGITWTE
jgi:putative zinc finger protein/HEAT repeat protein